MWDTHGVRYPVTVLQVRATLPMRLVGYLSRLLQVENCQVTANVKTVRDDSSEYHAVQVAASDRSPKNVTKQMLGHFNRAGVSPKRIVKEFRVSPDAHIPVGAYDARHLKKVS